LLKTWFRRCHLLLALLSGLFLISLSISGALLLYAKEIQRIVNPQYWLIELQTTNSRQLLPLATLKEKVETTHSQKIQFIEQSNVDNIAWQVRLQNDTYLSINQYNGNTLLHYNYYDTFYGVIMAWHRWLLYSDEQNEKPFKVLMSIASLLLIIELFFGLYLWAKPKHRLKRLKVKWQAKNRVLIHQLHTLLGVFGCIPLLLIAFSGMAFHWKMPTTNIVEWLTSSKVETGKYQTKELSASLLVKSGSQLNQAYSAAQMALPTGKVFRIYIPQEQGVPLALRITMPEESHANSWSWADITTGQLLESFDATKASTATQVWNFKYKFHIGEFIGWPIKILWLFFSLLPSFFVISGCYLWLKRKKR